MRNVKSSFVVCSVVAGLTTGCLPADYEDSLDEAIIEEEAVTTLQVRAGEWHEYRGARPEGIREDFERGGLCGSGWAYSRIESSWTDNPSGIGHCEVTRRSSDPNDCAVKVHIGMNGFPWVPPWASGTCHITVYRKPAPGPAVPTIYEHQDFEGASKGLGAGVYTSMRGMAVGNDVLTSLRVPAGWIVTLFEHDNFGGASRVYRATDGDGGDNWSVGDFNDTTSSMIVTRL